MKIALRYIITSLFITAVLYLMSVWILCKVQYNKLPAIYLLISDYAAPNGGFTYQSSLEWSDTAHYDVVVMGASKAQRGYDPVFFDSVGIKLFNLGTPAQSISNTWHLLENHIHAGNVKEVWLDIVPGQFKDGSIESTSDLIQNWIPQKTALEIAIDSKDIRSLNLWMKRIFCSNSVLSDEKSKYKGRGFVEVDAALSKDLLTKLENNEVPQYDHPFVEVGSNSIQDFESILAFCSLNQIELKVILSPMSVFANKCDILELQKFILPIMNQYHFPLIDYSHRAEWNTKIDFYDEKHLNAKGVRKFNRDLWINL